MDRSEIAKRRLASICDDRNKYPWLNCRRLSNGKYFMRSGTFGAGVVADIENNPDKYKIDIYADCQVVSKLPNPLTIKITNSHLVSPEDFPQIPVFLKTSQMQAFKVQSTYERIKPDNPFDLEKSRARALGELNMAPAIFDVVDRQTRDILLSDNYYMMQYYDSVGITDVVNNIELDLRTVWTVLGKQLATAMDKNDVMLADHTIKILADEGWIRMRTMLTLYDAILGLVRRLWGYGFRHCDLHHGNILAVKESVDINSSYFAGLILYGRGVPLTGDVQGLILGQDINDIRSELKKKGLRNVQFTVLHPDRLRLIDLAYLINVRDQEEVWAKQDAEFANPCRLLSSNRAEDPVELNRFLEKCTGKIVENAWNACQVASNLNTHATSESAKAILMKAKSTVVDPMKAFLDNLYSGVVRKNEKWQNCINDYWLYKRKPQITDNSKKGKKAKRPKENRRDTFHLYSPFKCTSQGQVEALKSAIEHILSVSPEVGSKLPINHKVIIIGQKGWPYLQPVSYDVEGHIAKSSVKSTALWKAIKRTKKRSSERFSSGKSLGNSLKKPLEDTNDADSSSSDVSSYSS